MPQPQIVVRHLSKTYQVPVREAGLRASLQSLVRKTYQDVAAVCDISFSIEAGEMVGFIGPNGAGKTTLGLAALQKRVELIEASNLAGIWTRQRDLSVREWDDALFACER